MTVLKQKKTQRLLLFQFSLTEMEQETVWDLCFVNSEDNPSKLYEARHLWPYRSWVDAPGIQGYVVVVWYKMIAQKQMCMQIMFHL